jgi:hypothetical protein
MSLKRTIRSDEQRTRKYAEPDDEDLGVAV